MSDDLFESAPESAPPQYLKPLEEGEEALLKEWVEKLPSLKMDIKNPISPPPPLLYLDECCILRRQRIAIVNGSAGSRKTSFLTLLCSAMGGGKTSPRLEVNGALKGVYIDTEQAHDQTFRIKQRIEAMGAKGQTEVFNTLDVPNEIIPQLIEGVIREYKPDYLILDNATDVFNGVMDEKEAKFAGRFIRQLASTYNICVICVIHLNEGGKQNYARGWIGKELTRKTDFIFRVEKKENADYSEIKFDKVRDTQAPNPVKIFHDKETGFPMLGDPATSASSAEPNPDKYADIVREIPANGISYNDLSKLITSKTNKTASTAKRWIKDMTDANVISQNNGRYYARQEPTIFSDSTDDELPF